MMLECKILIQNQLRKNLDTVDFETFRGNIFEEYCEIYTQTYFYLTPIKEIKELLTLKRESVNSNFNHFSRSSNKMP